MKVLHVLSLLALLVISMQLQAAIRQIGLIIVQQSHLEEQSGEFRVSETADGELAEETIAHTCGRGHLVWWVC